MLRIKDWDKKRIVFLGDCITYDGAYCNFTEGYLVRNFLAKCNAEFINMGVNAETVSGLSEPTHPFKRPCLLERLDRILSEMKPDYVFFMYGLNDGLYAKFNEENFEAYKKGVLTSIEKVNASGAKLILLTPTPFDNRSYLGDMKEENEELCSIFMPYVGYNETLKKYSDWLLTLSDKVFSVIDVFSRINDYINGRFKVNPQYSSGDGIHPDYAIHWEISSEILKKLFNITLTKRPAYVEKPSTNEMFLLLHKNNKMVSDSWREYIGHSNINKDNALPVMQAMESYAETKETLLELVTSEGRSIEVSNYRGYIRHDFMINGRECIVVAPKTPKGNGEWIWRAEFFGAFDYADMALLERGYHLAYCRLSDMYGCPYAIRQMEKFRQFVVFKFKLNEKPIIFGFSRGGLYAVNYALKYYYNVSALYLDAPVLDMKSWPLKNNDANTKEALEAYGLTIDEFKNFKGNPIDNAEKLAELKIPVLFVIGAKDKTVPFDENSKPFIKKFEKAGGICEVIIKHDCDHHPHSLENPEPIVDFVEKYL